MVYVLDASVAFKWLVAEADTDQAIRLRDDYVASVHDLLAPDFFPAEVTHSLTRAERQRRVLPDQGARLLADLIMVLPVLHPSLSLLPRAYEISSANRHGIYDCLYIALAEREGCQLVTADDKMVKNLQSSFPFIVPLSSLP